MQGLRKMGLKRRLFIAFTIMTLVTVAVGAIGVVSMLLLESVRDELLTGGASAEEIIAASQQHILFTSCVILAVLVIGVIISLVLARRISLSIRRPLEKVLNVIGQMSETGDLNFTDECKQEIRDDGRYPDELGLLSKDFAQMMDGILDKVTALQVAATGDLTKFAPAASESDTLANATNVLIGNLNAMAREVKKSADQLRVGIVQISQGAQSLAQSTMEQSTTMETLMRTMKEVSSQTEDNAARSQEASDISTAIWSSAEEGRDSMDKMTQAMDEINTASQSISVVMKAIDDIAFQTNILSLNAAVEAARAGQHGRGFAVVADEVRNLATKSAAAAEDTNKLIANTMTKSGMGMDIVKDTSEYLNRIMNSVSENTWILKNIATSTAEQDEAFKEINRGFGQLTNVVHQNSATAEESAAATEEMSSQTDILLELVSRFRIGEEDEPVAFIASLVPAGPLVPEAGDDAAFVGPAASVVPEAGGDAVFVGSAAPVETAEPVVPTEPETSSLFVPGSESIFGTVSAAGGAPVPVAVVAGAAPGEGNGEHEPWKDDVSKY
jgi:methyl-accepting chemotaxis protein